jgi:hypothetical protein
VYTVDVLVVLTVFILLFGSAFYSKLTGGIQPSDKDVSDSLSALASQDARITRMKKEANSILLGSIVCNIVSLKLLEPGRVNHDYWTAAVYASCVGAAPAGVFIYRIVGLWRIGESKAIRIVAGITIIAINIAQSIRFFVNA